MKTLVEVVVSLPDHQCLELQRQVNIEGYEIKFSNEPFATTPVSIILNVFIEEGYDQGVQIFSQICEQVKKILCYDIYGYFHQQTRAQYRTSPMTSYEAWFQLVQ